MLSRTAANLYWMGRYVERAENTARIIEAADRMAKMPNKRREVSVMSGIPPPLPLAVTRH